MIKIGITGKNGFIGTHLYNSVKLIPNEFSLIDFNINFFEKESLLDAFVMKCDVIVHLAAMNRHNDPNIIYKTNIELVNKLVSSLERVETKTHVIFASSSQEINDNAYGRSKKKGRILLQNWAKSTGNILTGLIIPNVFGPFGHPKYNSVIATFCHQISIGETPKIEIDNKLKLIYVGELIDQIISKSKKQIHEPLSVVDHTSTAKVSDILKILNNFKDKYQDKGIIPHLNSDFELNLFNTFRSYMDIKNHFPVKFAKHTDSRGSFVEIIRLGVGGQVSFSTTLPGITRGNHYHTRKIERFAVIKGKALIQLRRIGTDELIKFYLDGDAPAYVDMPIWYTHNIKNIGKDILYTNFWINEAYDPDNSDTYFENV